MLDPVAFLTPCSACARHVRAEETRCPFCGVQRVRTTFRAHAVSPESRLGRSALFTFGAAVTLAGCASSVSPAFPDGAPMDTVASRDVLGVDARGVDVELPTPRDVLVDDQGSVQGLYGGPGPLLDAQVDDDGSITNLYGLPPPPDDAME